MHVTKRLMRLDTCVVSDALDALRLPGATIGLRPLWPVATTVAGRARTIRAVPVSEGVPNMHIATPLVDISQPGDVLVIDNRGRTDVSCWGGLLTVAALAKGIVGVIIDGACRDIHESESLGLPIFGRTVVPVSARGRIVQESMDCPVSICSVIVCRGDYVIADRSGTVFIRSNDADRVVTLAEKYAERELRMLDEIRSGNSVVEVMHDKKFPQQ